MRPTTTKWAFTTVSAESTAIAATLEDLRRALEKAESQPDAARRRDARLRYLHALGTVVMAFPTLSLAPPNVFSFSLYDSSRGSAPMKNVVYSNLLTELVWLGFWLVDDAATEAGDRNGLAWVGQYLQRNAQRIDPWLPDAITALALDGIPHTCTELANFGVLMAWAIELHRMPPDRLAFAEVVRIDAEQKRLLPNSEILQESINRMFAITYERRARSLADALREGALPRMEWASTLFEANLLYTAAGKTHEAEELSYRVFEASKKEIIIDADEWARATGDAHAFARVYMARAATPEGPREAPSLLPSAIPTALIDEDVKQKCMDMVQTTRTTVEAPPTPHQIMTAIAIVVNGKTTPETKKWLQNWLWTRLSWDADIESAEWTAHMRQWDQTLQARSAPSIGDRLKSWISARFTAPVARPVYASLPPLHSREAEASYVHTLQPQMRKVEEEEEDEEELDAAKHAERALHWALATAETRKR